MHENIVVAEIIVQAYEFVAISPDAVEGFDGSWGEEMKMRDGMTNCW